MKFTLYDKSTGRITGLLSIPDAMPQLLDMNLTEQTGAVKGEANPETHMVVDGAFVPLPVSILEAEARAKAEVEVKQSRNAMLIASDWTQVPDAPVDKAAWAAYRQALRDIPDQSGFPFDVIWPTPPT